MTEQFSPIVKIAGIIILAGVIGMFLYAMACAEIPGIKDIGYTTIGDQYIKNSNIITLDVPERYPSSETEVHSITWIGSNGQAWRVNIHANNKTIETAYEDQPRSLKVNNPAKRGIGVLVNDGLQRPEDLEILTEIGRGIEKYQDRCPENTTAWCLMEMVQQGVTYRSDILSTGKDDYWKYPIETLIQGGDCEDKAALLTELLHQNGYETLMLEIRGNHIAHVQVGIDANQVPGSRIYMMKGPLYHPRTEKYVPETQRYDPEVLLDATERGAPNEWDMLILANSTNPEASVSAEYAPGNNAYQMDRWPDLPYAESAATINL